MERWLKKQILEDLDDKMVFLAGPRQVGKTTLSKSLMKSFDYLNWDVDADRSRILSKTYQNRELIIFDEIHKYKTWRNYLKGLVDSDSEDRKILVTGSTKLDLLRKGGDSLQGRYHFLRLLPLTFAELKMKTQKDAQSLFSFSGFPEPFVAQSKVKCDRWSRSYRERMIRQEVPSNELIQDLGNMELFYNRLPEIVGGTLSINSIHEDMQIAHKTLTNWANALERLYAIFRLSAFGPPKIKAIKKEQKLFFYDWNAIKETGPRFENFLAVHLIKWIFYQQDVMGRDLDLRFYRDKVGREVDFVIIENNRPIHFIEAKIGDADISKGLKYLKEKYPSVPAHQVHLNGIKDYVNETGIIHTPAHKLLTTLI